MATIKPPSGTRQLQDTQYRIVTLDPQDPNNGATCFLRPSQALGFSLPEIIHAYAPGSECRPVQVPVGAVDFFEQV